MATLEQLIKRTRVELSDRNQRFYTSFFGDDTTMVIDLPASGLTPGETRVFENGGDFLVEGEDADYILDYEQGKILLPEPVEVGKIWVIDGTYNDYFSDEELADLVEEAFREHTHNYREPMEVEDLPAVEEFLVALLAAVKCYWILANDAATDIDVATPEGVSIPAAQRWTQLMGHITSLDMRYREMASAMNVGLHRIEVFQLRRVSRTTNRYIPIYIPKEVDDRTYPPDRVKPRIDRRDV